MLLLFGNLESPLAADYPGYRQQEMSINRDLNNDSNVPGYRGQPAGDIWILTRCYPRTGQDWFEVDWFWTKVEYPQGIPGCPPIDFYHASAVSLPYREDNKSQVLAENGDLFQTNNYYSNHQKENVFTVVVISQPTTTLLDEAVRQRRYWQRVKISSELSSKTFQNKSVDQVYHISDYVDNDEGDRQHEPCCPADLNVHTSESDRILHVPSSRRSNNRRARRLEALSNQERRLFGTRNSSHCGNNTISNQSLASNQMLSVNNRCLYNPMIFNSPVRPLAVYSLNLTCFYSDISCDTKTRISFTECTAKDLYFAPPECLGFSCTFGHDCLFLFGGLTDSEDVRLDEGRNLISVEPDASQNRDNDDHCHRSINSPTLPLSSVTNESLTQGHLTPRVNTSDIIYRNSLGTAQFFVLRPRALAGTII
ncbi:unnamed protein product [Heterobilharzia americana]|nr:unnamed protein product [Heterobilharzia americana]